MQLLILCIIGNIAEENARLLVASHSVESRVATSVRKLSADGVVFIAAGLLLHLAIEALLLALARRSLVHHATMMHLRLLLLAHAHLWLMRERGSLPTIMLLLLHRRLLLLVHHALVTILMIHLLLMMILVRIAGLAHVAWVRWLHMLLRELRLLLLLLEVSLLLLLRWIGEMLLVLLLLLLNGCTMRSELHVSVRCVVIFASLILDGSSLILVVLLVGWTRKLLGAASITSKVVVVLLLLLLLLITH